MSRAARLKFEIHFALANRTSNSDGHDEWGNFAISGTHVLHISFVSNIPNEMKEHRNSESTSLLEQKPGSYYSFYRKAAIANMASTYSEVPAHEQDETRECTEDDQPTNELSSFQDEPDASTEPNLPLSPFESDCDRDNDDSLTYFVDEAIENLGMGRFQLVVLTAAGLCFAADAMQVLQLTFLSQVLRLEWNLSDEETALITSILFIGAIFGTLTLGPLADKKGRKPVFLLAASIISVFGVAVATVTSYWALLANLFMVGWGVGGLTGEYL